MRFLIGTLTKKGGPGVALCELEGDAIKQRWTSNALLEPNWLIKTRAGTRFFATCESDAPDQDGFCGQVCEFSLTETGLSPLRVCFSHGDAPCHLSLSHDERFMYVANYSSGSLAVSPETVTGTTSERTPGSKVSVPAAVT